MPELKELVAQRDDVSARKEDLLAQAADLGQQQRALNDQIAVAEAAANDDAAVELIRARGKDGVVQARVTAATMPDAERAARFEALAAELAAG